MLTAAVTAHCPPAVANSVTLFLTLHRARACTHLSFFVNCLVYDCSQAELMYPHIATTDEKASINATWLRSLNNRNYHFTDWENEKAFKAVIGPQGEKAIINGDRLPLPAGVSFQDFSPPLNNHSLQPSC